MEAEFIKWGVIDVCLGFWTLIGLDFVSHWLLAWFVYRRRWAAVHEYVFGLSTTQTYSR